MIPVFKRRKGDGSLLISDSGEALAVRRERRGKGYYVPPKSPTVVRADAVGRVQHLGGDVRNSKHLLGQFQIQFGQFRNETFLWLAENALGYIAHLVAITENESAHSDSKNNWVNKMALVKYLRLFPEGNEAISVKAGKKGRSLPLPLPLHHRSFQPPPIQYEPSR
ncbi:uncharacterized protein LOC119720069 [Patiria miniata]|uniref:Uncharacterized protein n=1 Tax=Patiria miniata TaxID=46514 RepID=A0A913Z117_PATMI|nr:uncharacterized protein LOC119720069 [Patiria miniata]